MTVGFFPRSRTPATEVVWQRGLDRRAPRQATVRKKTIRQGNGPIMSSSSQQPPRSSKRLAKKKRPVQSASSSSANKVDLTGREKWAERKAEMYRNLKTGNLANARISHQGRGYVVTDQVIRHHQPDPVEYGWLLKDGYWWPAWRVPRNQYTNVAMEQCVIIPSLEISTSYFKRFENNWRHFDDVPKEVMRLKEQVESDPHPPRKKKKTSREYETYVHQFKPIFYKTSEAYKRARISIKLGRDDQILAKRREQRKSAGEDLFVQKQEGAKCAMHALNNVIGEALFTEDEFKKVSGGQEGWWSNFDIVDVGNEKKTDTHIFFVPGGLAKFTEIEFRKMLELHEIEQHAQFCGFVRNVDNHFNALRLIDGVFKCIESIGSKIRTVSDRQMLLEIQKGEATRNGLMPVWKISRNVPKKEVEQLRRRLNHNIHSEFLDLETRVKERYHVDFATMRASNLKIKPWNWNTDGGIYERHKGTKWTVLRPTTKGWATRRVMIYKNGVRLLFSPKEGVSIAEASVFSEEGNGYNLHQASGLNIFRDYILKRPWRQWFGCEDEGMNVWMEPPTEELNFQWVPYTDRPIILT